MMFCEIKGTADRSERSYKPVRQILEDFVTVYGGGTVSREYEFTKGHFKRGAE